MRLIDADALDDKYEVGQDPNDPHTEMCYIRVGCIDEASTIVAKPVRYGEWYTRMSTLSSVKCSLCGNWHEHETAFCPSCGARMKTS